MSNTPIKNVFLDCDGNADDLIAFLLLRLSQGLELVGTAITNADCYVEHSYTALRLIENYLGFPEVDTGLWKGEMPNPFPDAWREESLSYKELEVLKSVQNAVSPSQYDSVELMVDKLKQASDTVTVICTGPFTVLAEVLKRHPNLDRKIDEVVAMAGAINVDGNVTVDGADGSAEWNVYCDPLSFKTVLEHGIPIKLIPLDVTNQLPVELKLLRQLEIDSKKSKASAVALSLLDLQKGRQVYLWDPTTVIAVTNPELFKFESVNIDVSTTGKSLGQLFIEESGYPVQYSSRVLNRDAVEQTLLYSLNSKS